MTDIASKSDSNSQSVDPYWPQLDGMRSLAFMLVFFHHVSKVPAAQRVLPELILRCIDSICLWGWIGVDIFFTLSGFLITHLLLSEKKKFGSISFKLFFARRALRIWPVYYTLLIFACVIVPLMQWQSLNLHLYQDFLLKQFLPLTFFVGNYSLTFATNVLLKFTSGLAYPVVFLLLPTWSLAVEEQFYLTWPFLLKALPTPRAMYKIILILTITSLMVRAMLWYVSHYMLHMSYPIAIYYHTTLSHLEPLMAGALCAVTISYFPDFKQRLKPFVPHLMALLSALVVLSLYLFPDIALNTYMNIPLFTFVAFACLLLLVIALVSPAVAQGFSNKALASFGKLTYAMYLVHMFFIALADRILLPHMNQMAPWAQWPAKFVIALSLSYIFAFVSWHLLERRFLQMRKLFRRHA